MERAMAAGYSPCSVPTEPRWAPDVADLLARFEQRPPVYVGNGL